MKLVNAHTQAKDLVELWIDQYGNRSPEMVSRLRELGPNPSPDQVDDCFKEGLIGMGNRVVREYICTECCTSCNEVIEFDNADDNKWCTTIRVCVQCILQAMMLINP